MGFEKVYVTYFNDVYRYLYRLSGNAHIAEEFTAEIFFKALCSLDSFRGECDMRVWLCQIANNLYYNALRKNKKFVSIEDVEIGSVLPLEWHSDNTLVDMEDAAQLRVLLHNIPDPYKEVFIWRVFAELSYKQIGQIFNKTENWACVTYHRARMMIKQSMEELAHAE